MKSKQVTIFDKAMIAAVQEAIKPAHVDAKALIIVSPEHYWEVVNERLRSSRNEVIEECAKVADNFAEVTARIDGGFDNSTTAVGMTRIAESIRSLKDTTNG